MTKKWSKTEIDAFVLADRTAVRLNLASKGLKRVPDSVFELPKLQRLFLKFNEITKLPWEIGELENLEVLDLWGNCRARSRS